MFQTARFFLIFIEEILRVITDYIVIINANGFHYQTGKKGLKLLRVRACGVGRRFG